MADEQDEQPDVLSFTDDPRYKPWHQRTGIAQEKKRDWENPNVCEHKGGAWIDRAARTLECRKCGVQLDPLEYILIIQQRWSEIAWMYDAVREAKIKERRRLEKEQERRDARKKRPG